MKWTMKKIVGLVILLALLVFGYFYGEEGLRMVGVALETVTGAGLIDLSE